MADKALVALDGGTGEGGGQILRTALSLSLARGVPFEMTNIRARRPRPGLLPQHLTAVRGAALASGAKVHGASDGSKELRFEPGPLSAGDFDLDIVSAGSCSLVLQTLTVPLALAGAPSRIRVSGGTHVPSSPSFHFLSRHWSKAVEAIGFRFDFALRRAGFYPRGGGVVDGTVAALVEPRALRLEQRGGLEKVWGEVGAGRIKGDVAGRLREAAASRLWEARRLKVEWPDAAEFETASPGSHLIVGAQFETGRAAFGALGEKGAQPEIVGDRVARALLHFLDGDAVVDPWLADQLAVPMALSGQGGRIVTSEVTTHLATVAGVLELFGYSATVFGRRGGPGGLEVLPYLDTPSDGPG